MQTSLQGIANRARRKKNYRFFNLSTMLNEMYLQDSWKYINRKAASGIDRKVAKDYEMNLTENIKDIVDRLKRGIYKAKLVKRVYIPKTDGKLRPLGLPVIEDKLLQVAVSRILSAIYEQDFLSCSFGYRPNVGSKEAVKELTTSLQFGEYNYVVEADIKSYFNNINHEWLVKMLEQRILDKPFIRLIKKWLKAGILDTDGKVIHPVTGSPQGGVISPILANIYLHYALDLWFEKIIKPQCKGRAYLCRYADDFICAFKYKEDAEKFYEVMTERLKKFGLEIAEGKTRIFRFSRYNQKDGDRFDFLGFEFSWGLSHKGKTTIMRRTSRLKLKKSIQNLTKWCKENRSLKLRKFFMLLNSKLIGYYNYYGVIGNFQSLKEFIYLVERIIFKWLNRRSQKKSFDWKTFSVIKTYYKIEKPRIVEKPIKQLNLVLS